MNILFEFPSDEARNKWLLYHYLKNSKNLFGYHR